MQILIENKKDFIIIGPLNAAHYSKIFPLILSKKIYMGYTGVRKFYTPTNDIANIQVNP